MGFGLVYGALVLRFKNVGPLNNLLQFIIMGLCGAFFPITSLPENMKALSYTIPHTYAADLLRHYSMGSPTILLPFKSGLSSSAIPRCCLRSVSPP